MTVADYLNDLALRFKASDVQLHVSGSKYGASELLAGLGDFDKGRPIAIETGTEGCFIRDSVSDQRLFQVVWSPDREGWLLSDRDVKAHYFVTRSFYLASLCGSVNTSLDSELFDAFPDAVSWCQKCWDRKLIRSEKATSVATDRKIARVALPSFSISSPLPEVKRGLPVYESEIRGEKLERRDIIVGRGDDQLKLSIDVLRAQHRAGFIACRIASAHHDLQM